MNFRLLRLLLLAASLLFLNAEDAASAPDGEATSTEAAEGAEAEKDPTKELLESLTINMAAEVVDERTFALRDSVRGGRKLVRIGNMGPPEQGSLSEEEHKERVEAGKEALKKLVEKQMVFYKAAPDEHQPAKVEGEDEILLADVWTIDGRYIAGSLIDEGHFVKTQEYATDLAKNILTAEAEENKRESYKELQEALKASEKAKAEARAAQEEEEDDEPPEPFGFSGWLGILTLVGIVVGAFTNFGRPSSKKVNLNRKKGFFEKLFMKLKGA